MAEQKQNDTALQDRPMDMDFEMQNTLNEMIGRTDQVSCPSENAKGMTDRKEKSDAIEDNAELTPSDAPNTAPVDLSTEGMQANISPDQGAPDDTDTYWDREDLQEGSEYI